LTALAVLALASPYSGAQSATSDWLELDSSALRQKMAWETADWNDFSLGETAYPKFLLKYPADWKFNGYSVFDTSAGVKVAELAPGVVKLAPGQDCYSNMDSKKVPGRAIRIGKFHGRKVVGEFEDDYSGSTWHHVSYCLSDGKYAFLVSFTLKYRSASLERQFAQVVSSFRFVPKDTDK